MKALFAYIPTMKLLNPLCTSLLMLPFSVMATIYGADNRMDINQVPQLRPLASAVAITIPNNFINQRRDGKFEMEDVELLGGGSSVNACMNERFAKQPLIGNCTAFLIGKRLVVTAGHCILPNGIVTNSKHAFCDSFSFYFGFNVDQTGKTHEKGFTQDSLYKCTKVIRAETIEVNGVQKNDFALLELDRDVVPSIVPLKISTRVPSMNENVYTIGHPSGLPAKFSGNSPVISNKDTFHFEVNLDALAGNSGSPTFDQQGNVLGILISGHPVDYYQDPSGCNRVNKCDPTGKVCNENPHFPHQQLSNYIQYMNAVVPFIPKPKR